MAVQNMTKTQTKWQKLRDGVATALPAGSALVVDGQSYTQAQLLAKIDPLLTAFTASSATKSQAVSALSALRALEKEDAPFYGQLVAQLKLTLGKTNPLLEKFGLTLPKPKAVRTAAQKAVSAAKAKNTRTARGVLSKKKRAQLPVTPLAQLVLDAQGQPVAPVAAETGKAVPAEAAPGSAAGASAASSPAAPTKA